MTHRLREPVPDLLRRFVATPFRWLAKDYTVESNDLDVIDQFDRQDIAVPAGFYVRIIRDEVAPSLPTRRFCTATTCVLMAGATAVMVDREQRRMFVFLEPQMSAEEFVATILPGALHHPHITDVTRCDRESP